MNVPGGAFVSPKRCMPQQAIVPSNLSPHPLAMLANVPLGASACPESFAPQQTTVLSLFKAHEELKLPTS
jgi:hypothetical protein